MQPRLICGGGSHWDRTRTDAQSIRSAAIMYMAENPSSTCPEVEDLIEGGFLDASKGLTDVWDNEFQITCDGDTVSVTSAGADGDWDTEDDIR